MSKLVWDEVGSRFYETGVDHGVLYIPDGAGVYDDGVAWSGLTAITESPSGAEANAQYADNIKYLNLYSVEEFGATIEAFTYPTEFMQFDGLSVPTLGVSVGQQPRKPFGLSYRTQLGNDTEGNDLGYKLHLVYGCMASPSEKAYNTINDSPEPITFSWELSTLPVPVTGHKPTSILTINSTEVDADILADLELMLYGDTGIDPALPLPDTIIAMFESGVTVVTANAPTYNSGTDTLTIVATTGVTYYVDDEIITTGAHVITESTLVKARPNVGYVLTPGTDDDWFFVYVP
jgi:hypothetical protein